MSTAFQPNAFQPNGFQIGNIQQPGTALVIDSPMPRPLAVIGSVIFISSYVFFAPPVAATYPTGLTGPTQVVPAGSTSTAIVQSECYIPTLPAGSGYPVGLKAPVSLVPAGAGSTTIVQSECYTPPVPQGSGYPAGLEGPIKPVNPLPRRPRAWNAGTVGVAFAIPTYDFGWADTTLHPRIPPVRAPRHDSSYTYQTPPVASGFPAGLTEPQRPQNLKPDAISRYLKQSVPFFMPLSYSGWAEPNPFPPLRKPTVPQFNAEPSFTPPPPQPGSTYDYGWFAPPKLPVQQKPSNAVRLAPDIHIIAAGATPDYGWTAVPRLPVPPKPWMAHNLWFQYFPWENAEPTEIERPHGGHYPEKLPRGGRLKKKKHKPAPWELSNEEVRTSLMKVVEATEQRKRDIIERQDEEDLIEIMRKMGLL